MSENDRFLKNEDFFYKKKITVINPNERNT